MHDMLTLVRGLSNGVCGTLIYMYVNMAVSHYWMLGCTCQLHRFHQFTREIYIHTVHTHTHICIYGFTLLDAWFHRVHLLDRMISSLTTYSLETAWVPDCRARCWLLDHLFISYIVSATSSTAESLSLNGNPSKLVNISSWQEI